MSQAKTQEEQEKYGKIYAKALQEHYDNIFKLGIAKGQESETQNYMKMCDDMIQALGGDKALLEKNAENNYEM